MDSFETTGTTTQPQPVEAKRDRERRPHGAAPKREDPKRAAQAAPRCSPDPFVETDRYRLTMPYADRI